MSKNTDSMPQIVNRKLESEPADDPVETKSEGDEAVEGLEESK